MRHIPHLLVDVSADGETLAITGGQYHHLTRVLRAGAGDPVTYTDGKGLFGEGQLGQGLSLVRGEERAMARPPLLDVAAAPPGSKDRARFLVEKLAEIGVNRLLWLRTVHGANRRPDAAKTRAWAQSALEQSRGVWLMGVDGTLSDWSKLESPVLVCEAGSGRPGIKPRTVVIGPEGGWADDEIPPNLARWGLVPNVLRVETAAIVAASLVLAGVAD